MKGLDPSGPVLFAFLRAVNLGKHNQVRMARLMELMRDRGLPPAAYLLASGNLALSAEAGAATDLRGRIVDLIEEEFGVSTAAVFRTPAELRSLLVADPFTPRGMKPVYVSIWDGEAYAEGLAWLARQDFSPDALELVAGAAIMGYAATSHDSKLLNALIERRLEVAATARNVNTFRRLLDRFAPEG